MLHFTVCHFLCHKKRFDIEQEDKEPVFDSVKTILGMLEVSAEFAQNISFNRERIEKALPAGYLDATTLADYLVKKVTSPYWFSSKRSSCNNYIESSIESSVIVMSSIFILAKRRPHFNTSKVIEASIVECFIV